MPQGYLTGSLLTSEPQLPKFLFFSYSISFSDAVGGKCPSFPPFLTHFHALVLQRAEG